LGLGPLFFLLYINDFPHTARGRPIIYGDDDTSILNIGQDINSVQIITSGNMGVIEQYF
jgi:hypothetical protein